MKVRAKTGQKRASELVMERRLRFFGHVARTNPNEDYHRAVKAAIGRPPPTQMGGRDRKAGQGPPGCVLWKWTCSL